MTSEKDFIQQFIDALHSEGQPPAPGVSVIADNEWHRYTVAGDKEPNARYQLAIEGDFAYGRFIYFKIGESHNWHSKSGKKLTAAEKKERKKQIAEAKKQKEKEQAEEFERVAVDCAAVWARGREKKHEYLTRKNVPVTGTRVADLVDAEGKEQKDVLLIPVYKNGKLTSLQRIWPGGFKAFWEGGDVAGGYTAFVNADDDKSTIVICEGFATGSSIRQAMEGWPVIVAFNASNLMPVAQLMRQKYPKARIIIAADNDQWTFDVKRRVEGVTPKKVPGDDSRWREWREEKRLFNPGVDKALQVGVKVGAHVIYPDIPPDDKEKNTDFNDLMHMRGVDAVRNRILAAAPANRQPDRAGGAVDSRASACPPYDSPEWMEEQPEYSREEISRLYGVEDAHPLEPVDMTDLFNAPNPADKEDLDAPWREDLYCNEDGTTKANSLRNAHIFISKHVRYKGMFCFDEFAQEKVVTRCPPWEMKPDKFEVRALRDEDITDLAIDLEPRGICLSIQNLKKVLDSVIVANRQNPAREYFNSLKWDGIPRLNTWLREYCGCISDDPEYLAAIGRKWLTAGVARVMRPGCKFDHILIFEGNQKIGKSMMLRELATIHGRPYFDDTIKAKDLPNPSIVPKLQGCLIIELAEMSGFRKMSSEEAKQIISTQEDRIVKKYHNEPTRLPRQFIFAGSINDYSGYLDDPTGNRRYWPAKCTTINIEGIKRDKEQLWAEAVECWREGEKLWLEEDFLYKKAEEAQLRRAEQHPWQNDIEGALSTTSGFITMDDIWKALLIDDRSRRTKQAQDDIAKIMTGLGYEWKRKQVSGRRSMVWAQSDTPDLLDDLAKKEEEEIQWPF